MAWLWSNPTPGGSTLPQLQSQFQVQAPNIGGLIAAIMEQRNREAQLKQQQFNSLIAGAGSVAGGLYSGYQQNQQNDLANRSMYQMQNPGDPYTGQPGYDDRVPDYGGTDALRMQSLQNSLTGGSALERQMLRARINSENAHANYYNSGGRTASQDLAQEREARISLGAQITEKEQELKGLGLSEPELAQASNAAGEEIDGTFVGQGGSTANYFSPNRIAEGKVMQIPQGTNKQGEDIPAKQVDMATFNRAKQLSTELADMRQQLITGQYKQAAGFGGGLQGRGAQGGAAGPTTGTKSAQIEAVRAEYEASDKSAASYEKAARALRALGVGL